MTQHYELLFIIPGSYNDSEVPTIKEKVVSFIAKVGGQITKDQDYERKKLAYDIGQESFGHYWLMEFDAEGGNIKELNHQLELAPEILRFIIAKARIKTAEDVAQEAAVKEKITARKAERVKQELKEVTKTEKPLDKLVVKKEEDKTEGKVSMEDLDKKLDEILGDNLKV